MIAAIPFDLNLARWELWTIPVAGFLCTGLVLMGGRWLLRRRQPSLEATDTHNPYSAVSTPKRRQTPRGRGAPSRILILAKNGPKDPFSGWVINRSIGGLFALRFFNRFEEGALLKVCPAKDVLNDDWYEVLVRYCRATETGWEMGCEFQGRGGSNAMLKFNA